MSFARQPQFAALIARGNPLARGLQFAWIPASDMLSKSGTPTKAANLAGMALVTDGTAYEFMNSAPTFTLDECTVIALLTPDNIATMGTVAISCGSSTDADPLFILGQSGSSNQLEFRTRDSAAANTTLASLSSHWASGRPCVAAGVRSLIGGYQRVFANGVRLNTTAVSAVTATTFDRFAIGGLLRSSFASGWAGKTHAVFIYNRGLSDAEIATVSQNIWQLYQAPVRRRFAPPAAVGGGFQIAWAANSNVLIQPQVH